jgi:hypothetical protein
MRIPLVDLGVCRYIRDRTGLRQSVGYPSRARLGSKVALCSPSRCLLSDVVWRRAFEESEGFEVLP